MSEIVKTNTEILTLNVENALEEWEAYQELTKNLLDDSDYQVAKNGKKYKKKSAWQKYARAFNINTEIISKEIIRSKTNKVIEAEYTVRATLPNGRYVESDGSCDRLEKGKREMSNHSIKATAKTRATNRAISELIGAGEVSYDELDPAFDNIKKSNKEVIPTEIVEPDNKPYIEPEFTTAEDVKPVKLDPVLLNYCKTLRNKLIEKGIPVSQSSMKDQLFLCIKAKEIDEFYKIPLIEFIYSHCPEELLK